MDATSKQTKCASFFAILLVAAFGALGFTWPWEAAGPWPRSSIRPVAPLDHRSIQGELVASDTTRPVLYRFAVFGDQRALADGEWQELLEGIVQVRRRDPSLLFLLDTGDFLRNGCYSDQYWMTREILSAVSDLPYLVAVGNHEVSNNESLEARRNTATFLSYLDPDFGQDRMYYEKKIGPVRFLFLDTNDLVYGDTGEIDDPTSPPHASRAEAQLDWLVRQLAASQQRESKTTIAVMHHPIIQSSAKHRSQARALWSYRYKGRTLPDILADGGVEIILTGHTHTYERFRLRRDDGREIQIINFSGRPRTSILWIGEETRRAKDLEGKENEWLRRKGWQDLERWEVTQEEVMRESEANQFGLFSIYDRGEVSMEVFYLEDKGRDELRRGSVIRLKARDTATP